MNLRKSSIWCQGKEIKTTLEPLDLALRINFFLLFYRYAGFIRLNIENANEFVGGNQTNKILSEPILLDGYEFRLVAWLAKKADDNHELYLTSILYVTHTGNKV